MVKKKNFVILALAMILSALQIVGHSFSRFDNWNAVLYQGSVQPKALIQWVVISGFFFIII